MGLCINCKYHTTQSSSARLLDGRIRPSGHYCNNENNEEMDYVTGSIFLGSCYAHNGFEECLFYEELPEDDTNTDNPIDDSGDNVVDNPDDSGDGPIDTPEDNNQTTEDISDPIIEDTSDDSVETGDNID